MRTALCCVLLGGIATGAVAQDTQVTFEEPQPVTITGFAVGRADYDRAARSNGFTAGKIALSLFKPVGDAYFFGQLTTAFEEGATETEIDHLIVSWTPKDANRWTLAFGRFNAPIGMERDEEPLNFLPTGSFTFTFARPRDLTGALVQFTASPRSELVAMVANGWNRVEDNNRGKTALIRAQWLPAQAVTLGLTAVYGPERDSSDAHQRTLVSNDLTLQAGRLILGAEVNLGRERASPRALEWGGGTATAFVRLGRSVGLAVRYDHVEDPDGLLTGTAQTLRSFTVGPMWFFRSAQAGVFSNIEHTTFHLPQFAVRAAVRADRSSVPYFVREDGGQQRTDTRGVVELVYLF